jgi:hypothetical protein
MEERIWATLPPLRQPSFLLFDGDNEVLPQLHLVHATAPASCSACPRTRMELPVGDRSSSPLVAFLLVAGASPAAVTADLHSRIEGMYLCFSSLLGGKMHASLANAVGEKIRDAQCRMEMQ